MLLHCVNTEALMVVKSRCEDLLLCRLNLWRAELKAQLTAGTRVCVLSSLGGNAVVCAPFATKTCQQVWYAASLMKGTG